MRTIVRRLVALLLLGFAVSSAAQTVPGEYGLKAAFLYRFPQFVDWPDSALSNATAVQLCVVRPNPFGAELDRLVRGESLRGRPLEVRTLNAVGDLDGCHLLFIGAKAANGAAMLTSARERPILTVGETDAFLSSGGIINLRLINNLVRFEVNADAVQRSGLRMSTQLLGLAMAVRGGAP